MRVVPRDFQLESRPRTDRGRDFFYYPQDPHHPTKEARDDGEEEGEAQASSSDVRPWPRSQRAGRQPRVREGQPRWQGAQRRAPARDPGRRAHPRRHPRDLRLELGAGMTEESTATTPPSNGASTGGTDMSTPRHLTGAHLVLECLLREHVDPIFAYPRGANLPLYQHLP